MVVAQHPQTIARTAVGIFSQANPLDLPPGALVRADNCTLDREGLIESRRGFERYMTLTNPATDLMHFQRRLVVLDGTLLKYDSDGLGTVGTWTGTFARPTPTTRITFEEVNQNLYFTTERGVMKNDSLTGAPVRAGMPQGLDIETAFLGTGGGFGIVNAQWGYRVVFGRTDANLNLLLGAPSNRVVVTNPVTAVTMTYSSNTVTVTHTAHGYATSDTVELHTAQDPQYGLGAHVITVTGADTYTYPLTPTGTPTATSTGSIGKKLNVRLTITVPQGVDLRAGDVWEVHRTKPSASATGIGADPGMRHFRVTQKTLTTGDLTTGTVTFDDTKDDSFIENSPPLYTNDSEETEAQANDRPPWAKRIVLFKDHVRYLNLKREHRVSSRMDSLSAITAESSTITVGSYVYTFSAARDIANRKFKLDTTATTDAQRIAATMRDFCVVVNRDPNNSLYQAFYISQANDDPGMVTVMHRALNGQPFTATSSAASSFTPPLPLTSEDLAGKNLVARSKFGEPESVPFFNTYPVGRASKEIQTAVACKDGLIYGTEEGHFIESGESDGGGGFNFVVNPLEPSIDVRAQNSAVLLDNAYYGYTSQGVMRLVAAASGIVSRQVYRDLNRISKFPQFSTISHACSYETENKYLLATQETRGDVLTRILWTYNYLTGAWTQWRKPVSAMVVIPTPDDRLYLAHGEEPYILRERKDLTQNLQDYVDEEITDTITATGTAGGVTTVDVTHTYSEPLTAGWSFTQGATKSRVTAVTSLGGNSYRLTLKHLVTVSVTTCNLGIPIPVKIEWIPEDAGNPALLKQYTVAQFYQESNSAFTHRAGFFADTRSVFAYAATTTLPARRGWGSNKWGTAPWGDTGGLRTSTPIEFMVPRDHQICTALRVLYEHAQAKEKVSIAQMALKYKVQGTNTQRKTA